MDSCVLWLHGWHSIRWCPETGEGQMRIALTTLVILSFIAGISGGAVWLAANQMWWTLAVCIAVYAVIMSLGIAIETDRDISRSRNQ